MTGWEFDLDLLDKTSIRWVPFTVRYGYQKISDFTRKDPYWPAPAVPGTLWERVTSDGHTESLKRAPGNAVTEQTIAEARAWATGDLIPPDVADLLDVLANMLSNELAARKGTP